ncbi:MAG: hypothetical protein WBM04_05815 [Candidatus Korobacteraceae bacterium]
MKLQKLIPIGILLLVSAATLSAQNTLPNPHDDACWSSLSALRACDIQAYDRVMEQALRCTSYPEYQCLPPEVSLHKTSATNSAKAIGKTTNSADNAVAVSAPVASDPNTQASNSK